MPDVVDFKPVRARRPHRSVLPKLLNIKGLDWRISASAGITTGKQSHIATQTHQFFGKPGD